jgi:hypothetical protein
MVSRTQLGHLLVFHVDDGTLVDFGYSPDNGRISSDGSLLAHLVYRLGCAVPQPSDDLDILCFDIYVSSSDGRTQVQVGDGLRVLLDDYQFAGNGHLIFTNDTGSLFSTATPKACLTATTTRVHGRVARPPPTARPCSSARRPPSRRPSPARCRNAPSSSTPRVRSSFTTTRRTW